MQRYAPKNCRTAPTITGAARKSLSQKHLGVIYSRCLYYWRMLPPYFKNFYSVEDLVSDVVLHVFCKRAQYDPRKAKEVTWIYHVTDNYCRSVCIKASRICRFAPTVDLTPEGMRQIAAQERLTRRESRECLEKVMMYCSESALDLLSSILEGNAPRHLARKCTLKKGKWVLPTLCEAEQAAIRNLKEVAELCGATCTDFERVIRYSVA